MTKEQFLKEAKSNKTGLSYRQYIDAVTDDVKRYMELSKEGNVYNISLENDPLLLRLVNKILNGDRSKDNYISCFCFVYRTFAENRYNDKYLKKVYPFEVICSSLLNEDVERLIKYCKITIKEIIEAEITPRIYDEWYNQVINSMDALMEYGIKLEEEIDCNDVKSDRKPKRKISPTIESDNREEKNPADELAEVEQDIQFQNESNISSTDKLRIVNVFSDDTTVHELRKLKIRRSENTTTFTEMPDSKFDAERFDFAFVADSMLKGKQIMVGIKLEDGTENVEFSLVDSIIE